LAMTLAELLPTPAHAEALARHLVVTVIIFDSEYEADGELPIVELVTAVLWDLAQQGCTLAALPRALAGGRHALAGWEALDETVRAVLERPDADRQLRAWADALKDVIRHGLVSEMVEREAAQKAAAMIEAEDEHEED
jgi:hypothetical protein